MFLANELWEHIFSFLDFKSSIRAGLEDFKLICYLLFKQKMTVMDYISKPGFYLPLSLWKKIYKKIYDHRIHKNVCIWNDEFSDFYCDKPIQLFYPGMICPYYLMRNPLKGKKICLEDCCHMSLIDMEVVEKYFEYFNMDSYIESRNSFHLPTEQLLKYVSGKFKIKKISHRGDLSHEFLKQYKDRLNWKDVTINNICLKDHLYEFRDFIEWNELYRNKQFNKSDNLDEIKKVEDRINWEDTWSSIKLSKELMEKFIDKINWYSLCLNSSLTFDILKKHEKYIDWEAIKTNICDSDTELTKDKVKFYVEFIDKVGYDDPNVVLDPEIFPQIKDRVNFSNINFSGHELTPDQIKLIISLT